MIFVCCCWQLTSIPALDIFTYRDTAKLSLAAPLPLCLYQNTENWSVLFLYLKTKIPTGLPWWLSGKESQPANAEDRGSIPDSRRSHQKKKQLKKKKPIKRSLNSACLLLSVYNLGYKSRIFTCLGKLSYDCLSLNPLPVFYPSHFQCGEMSLSIPWMWRFSLSLIYLQPVMTIFLVYADKAAFTEFLWSHVWPLLEAVSIFPWSAISSLTSFTFDQNFTSSIVIFLFYNWFLIANSFFQLSISVEGHLALSLGDKQTMQL